MLIFLLIDDTRFHGEISEQIYCVGENTINIVFLLILYNKSMTFSVELTFKIKSSD